MHYLRIAMQEDEKIQSLRASFLREVDKTMSNKQAFRQVKGSGPPPVQEILKSVQMDAIIVSSDDRCTHEIFADQRSLSQLDPCFGLEVCGHSLSISSLCSSHCVATSERPLDFPTDAVATQKQFTNGPKQVASLLNGFWLPIWQRDDLDLSFLTQSAQQLGFQDFLANLPTLPGFTLEVSNLDNWKSAIKKLKPGSARGLDMISAQELKLLPDVAIQSLADVCSSLQDGFGAEFMHGMICPLSKVGVHDTPTASQTRPIVVLPQVYRLWATVICSQITKALAKIIPCEINGLLPNRGAISAAYHAQFRTETARFFKRCLSGLVLDLRKCFNCISWAFAFHALCALGIPVRILIPWILSQRDLTKHWLISGSTFEAGASTTGFCEGDPLSILAMLSVATSWVTYLRSQVSQPDTMALSAYADNWGWTLEFIPDHAILMRSTLALTRAVGLDVDWQKTWWWATDGSVASSVQSTLQNEAPLLLQHRHSMSDLGFQAQYSGRTQLGILQDRLAKGTERIQRLHAMPHCLSVKEAMLRCSIYPATFYGYEAKPPAQNVFTQLRSAAARALIGPVKVLSSPIVLALTKGGILDPEFWFILRAIATARSFLLNATPQVVNDFFWISSRFRGSLHQVRGPASALSHLLCGIGWQITADGFLHVSAFQSFPLLSTSLQRLRRFLVHTWQDGLVRSLTSRFSWFQFPDIDLVNTPRVLARFSDSQRRVHLKEIAGGCQLASQKKHWLDSADGLCPHCKMEDTRTHRLLECPLGAEVRVPFKPSLDFLVESESCLLEYPVIMVDPDVQALSLLHFSFPVVSWPEACLRHVLHAVDCGVDMHWYTDGSCLFPESPLTRHAAFAVVWDLCLSDDERRIQADRFLSTKEHPHSFEVVAAGRSHGEQDILRAELHAIVSVILNVGQGHIHADSQSAIDYVNLALSADSPRDFARKDHMDLLMQVWHRRHEVRVQLHKVKAHENLTDFTNLMDCYAALGNWKADNAAGDVALKAIPEVATKHQHCHDFLEQQMEHLHTVLQLHHDVKDIAAKTMETHKPELAVSHDHRQIWDAFRGWKVHQPHFAAPDADLQFLRLSMFDEELAVSTYRWIKALKWPSDESGPLNKDVGISWVELALSWIHTNGTYLPIVRPDASKEKYLFWPRNDTDLADHGSSYTEQGNMLQKLVENTCALIPEKVWPSQTRKKVSSIYVLGGGKYHQGLVRRPEVPQQEQMMSSLDQVIRQGKGTLLGVPKMGFSAASKRFGETYAAMHKKSASGMYHVRTARKLRGLWWCT